MTPRINYWFRAAARKKTWHPSWRIRTADDLREALACPNKSSATLTKIIDFAYHPRNVGYVPNALDANGDASLVALLGEPALTGANLLSMARVVDSWSSFGNHRDLQTAICGHPLADDNIRTAVLWNAGPDVLHDVATRTRCLLPAVIGWLRREILYGDGSSLLPEPDQRRQLDATLAWWESWSAGNPERRTFLLTSWPMFTTEDDMFAAGLAMLAGPRRTPTHAA